MSSGIPEHRLLSHPELSYARDLIAYEDDRELMGRMGVTSRQLRYTAQKSDALSHALELLQQETQQEIERQKAALKDGENSVTLDRHSEMTIDSLMSDSDEVEIGMALMLIGLDHVLTTRHYKAQEAALEATRSPESDGIQDNVSETLYGEYDALGAFEHIVAVLGNGPCSQNHCEGCRYETEDVRDLARYMLKKLTPTQDELEERERQAIMRDEGIMG